MPALGIYDTARLLMAVQGIDPAHSFLRDRYFPTDAASVFSTEKVLVEYREGNRKLAPFVAPRKGGVTMTREGMAMREYMPPTVAPSRPITLDDITKRGFGEALYSQIGPQQREQVLAMGDLAELDHAITRREEAMAAEVMLTNGCVMSAMGDSAESTADSEIHFYDEDANPASYAVTTKWDDPEANILGDMQAMARLLTERGLPATDFVCSPDVANAILDNDDVYRMLDNRRYNVGEVAPTLESDSASVVCVLNIFGRNINIIAYDATYVADDGTVKPYLPSGSGVMTAEAAGRTLYGAVSQIEQGDGMFHTYAEKRVPKYTSDVEGNARKLTLTSRPLLVPGNKNPWIASTALLTA